MNSWLIIYCSIKVNFIWNKVIWLSPNLKPTKPIFASFTQPRMNPFLLHFNEPISTALCLWTASLFFQGKKFWKTWFQTWREMLILLHNNGCTCGLMFTLRCVFSIAQSPWQCACHQLLYTRQNFNKVISVTFLNQCFVSDNESASN